MSVVGGVPRLSSPWELYAGDDCGLKVRIMDGSEPASLDDVEVRAAWRRSRDASLAVELPVDVVEGEPGVVLVRVDGELTAVQGGLVRDGVFDVQVVRNGNTSTVLTGEVDWVKDVTR